MYRFLLVDDEINISKALRRLLLNNAIAPQLPEFMVTIHDSPHCDAPGLARAATKKAGRRRPRPNPPRLPSASLGVAQFRGASRLTRKLPHQRDQVGSRCSAFWRNLVQPTSLAAGVLVGLAVPYSGS